MTGLEFVRRFAGEVMGWPTSELGRIGQHVTEFQRHSTHADLEVSWYANGSWNTTTTRITLDTTEQKVRDFLTRTVPRLLAAWDEMQTGPGEPMLRRIDVIKGRRPTRAEVEAVMIKGVSRWVIAKPDDEDFQTNVRHYNKADEMPESYWGAIAPGMIWRPIDAAGEPMTLVVKSDPQQDPPVIRDGAPPAWASDWPWWMIETTGKSWLKVHFTGINIRRASGHYVDSKSIRRHYPCQPDSPLPAPWPVKK